MKAFDEDDFTEKDIPKILRMLRVTISASPGWKLPSTQAVHTVVKIMEQAIRDGDTEALADVASRWAEEKGKR